MNAPGAPRMRAVIADDERLMREQLRLRLSQVWPELDIVAEGRNGVEAVELTQQHRPDVVFLDIRMPGMTGVDAAREILQMEVGDDAWLPDIVFITAYDQYAVQAVEQGAVDYVLKPAEPERLRRTAERLQARLTQRGQTEQPDSTTATPAGTAPADGAFDRHPAAIRQLLQDLSSQLSGRPRERLEMIQASVGSAVQMIPVAEVLFFISDEKYTRVQTATAEALIRKPIKELVDELDPRQFWQIHRSTLVNVNAVASVTRDHRGRQMVHLRAHPQVLEVSRAHSGVFKGM